MPEFIYERVGNYLIAEDDGFYYFYGYKKSTEAFCGREFDIPLANGDVEKATGQWWQSFPEDYQELVYSLGISTPDLLGKCHVFYSANVDIQIVDEWLSNNEFSNNYRKYDKRDENYGLHKIFSKWDEVA